MIRTSNTKFLYPGDSHDKRAARLFLYKYALQAPRNSLAITLAGISPESEIRLLRDYLKWPASDVIFVDSSKEPDVIDALHKIIKLWPEAGVYPGLLQTILSNTKPKSIGFVNLDFMGHLNSYNVIPCIKLITPRMLPGSIMGLTWERGRELRHLPNSSGAKTLRAGNRYKDLNDQRWAGVLKIVDKLSKGTLRFVGGVEYQNNHSPMSLTVFEKIMI